MRTLLRDLLKGFLLTAFFISTLLLSLWSERVFVSPDENAAFFFAKQFATTGSLAVHETLNASFAGLIHPRSVAVLHDLLVPGSFLGMPIFSGVLMTAFGDAGGLLLTPVLALLGILAFHAVIKKLFEDEPLADLSALFFMLHPAYLYYSGRVMMHNVAFLDLLIFAAFFAVCKPFGMKSVFVREFRRFEHFLSGVFLGLALFFRLSEAVWVLPVAIGLLIYVRNTLGWRNVVWFMVGFALVTLLAFYANSVVYGSPFLTGYTLPNPTVTMETIQTAPAQNASFSWLGVHPRGMLRNVWNYLVLLYPWMSLSALAGFALLAYKKFEEQTAWKALSVIGIAVGIVLVVLYGSWNFLDNPDPALVTIGNSHIRYWLPLFALAAPFSAYAVLALWRTQRILMKIPLMALVLLGFAANVHLVFFGHDGILASRAAMATFIEKRTEILSKTEPNAVIVVDRVDKYLFPYRKVVVPLRDEKTYAALPALVNEGPTYYFGITFPESDLAYLNNEKLQGLSEPLRIELVETIDDESLYAFTHATLR